MDSYPVNWLGLHALAAVTLVAGVTVSLSETDITRIAKPLLTNRSKACWMFSVAAAVRVRTAAGSHALHLKESLSQGMNDATIMLL
jgi:hypothetical protein